MKIAFSPLAPDRSPFDPSSSPWTINAIPVADGWAPLPKMKEISDALGADCLAAFAAQTESGTWVTFAFTAAAIYKLDTTDNSWEDVTGVSGPYSAAHWSVTKFGSYVIAANGVDPMQKFDIEGDTDFSDVGGSPPAAKYVAVVGDFLVAFNISGDPGKLQWSEINDIEGWEAGENLSDFNILADLGGIQAVVTAPNGAIICCELGFMSMTFALTSQWVFTFDLIHKARGVAAPFGVVQIGPGDFVYYSYEGFFRGDTPIGGERLDRWFSSFSDSGEIAAMQGALDPARKIVWFRFKATNAQYYLLGYNFQLDRWCLSDNQVQAMVRLGSPSITNDGMDNYWATIDEIDVPFDSSFWSANAPNFGGVTQNQKLAYQSGQPAQAVFRTNRLMLGDGMRVMLNSGRIFSDAENFTVKLSTADYESGALNDRTPVSPSARTKMIPLRGDGRVHQIEVIIPADEEWTFAGGLDVSVVPGATS